MKPSFSIGIPTINRIDLLYPALLYYQHDFPDTRFVLIDNGHQNIDKIREIELAPGTVVYQPQKNLGVAKSWNSLIRIIFEDPEIKYAAILNDDIYWGYEQETLNVFLALHENKKFRAPCSEKGFILVTEDSKYDWCSFIISRAAWETIGPFDEKFYPAYFEDSDYKYRAKLAGVAIDKVLSAPARFMHSSSVKKDRHLLDNSEKNYNYYVSKWGGEPGKETYSIPFDNGK